jgi:hypothetical protein
MKITSSKDGGQKITMSRKEWEAIGKKAGWEFLKKWKEENEGAGKLDDDDNDKEDDGDKKDDGKKTKKRKKNDAVKEKDTCKE